MSVGVGRAKLSGLGVKVDVGAGAKTEREVVPSGGAHPKLRRGAVATIVGQMALVDPRQGSCEPGQEVFLVLKLPGVSTFRVIIGLVNSAQCDERLAVHDGCRRRE